MYRYVVLSCVGLLSSIARCRIVMRTTYLALPSVCFVPATIRYEYGICPRLLYWYLTHSGYAIVAIADRRRTLPPRVAVFVVVPVIVCRTWHGMAWHVMSCLTPDMQRNAINS